MKIAIVIFACLVVAAQAALPNGFKKSGAASEASGVWAGPMPFGGVESGISGTCCIGV